MARASPAKVTVTFTHGAECRPQGPGATVILMGRGRGVGRSDATQGMDVGKPTARCSSCCNNLALGGRVAICSSCMIHNGFTAEQMDPRFAIITAPEVIDLLMNARGSLQIT